MPENRYKSDKLGSSGFTLVDLLWVVLILAIAMSAAGTYFSNTLFYLGSEKKARELYMALSYSQQKALNKNDTFGLFYDTTHGRFTCYQHIGYDGGTGEPLIDANNILYHPLTKKPYVIDLNQESEYNDIQTAEADFGGNHWVEFSPLGDPKQGGQITLTGDDFSHVISVSQTGRLSIE